MHGVIQTMLQNLDSRETKLTGFPGNQPLSDLLCSTTKTLEVVMGQYLQVTVHCYPLMSQLWKQFHLIRNRKHTMFLSSLSINLLAFYDECDSLIGYASHYLFCDRQRVT